MTLSHFAFEVQFWSGIGQVFFNSFRATFKVHIWYSLQSSSSVLHNLMYTVVWDSFIWYIITNVEACYLNGSSVLVAISKKEISDKLHSLNCLKINQTIASLLSEQIKTLWSWKLMKWGIWHMLCMLNAYGVSLFCFVKIL